MRGAQDAIYVTGVHDAKSRGTSKDRCLSLTSSSKVAECERGCSLEGEFSSDE